MPLRILLVEDHDGTAVTITAMLNALGYSRVSRVRDAEAAIADLKETAYDLLLCDQQLGLVTGLTLLKMIRRHEGLTNPMVPFVLVTAHAEGTLVSEAVSAGCNDVLVKPVMPEALLRCLDQVLNRPRAFVKTKEYTGPDRRRRKTLDNPGRRDEDQTGQRKLGRNPWITPPKT
ncbi:response regulator [Ferrovibrio sp. MS7]|uniref:response regulator n=1 Tax=Ferrovibrio plantarum TaxID=3119164 RepID=UPI001B62F122|nr:response regulator [Ferrovibrio sp.]